MCQKNELDEEETKNDYNKEASKVQIHWNEEFFFKEWNTESEKKHEMSDHVIYKSNYMYSLGIKVKRIWKDKREKKTESTVMTNNFFSLDMFFFQNWYIQRAKTVRLKNKNENIETHFDY